MENKQEPEKQKLREFIPNCQYFGKYNKESLNIFENLMQEINNKERKNVNELVTEVYGDVLDCSENKTDKSKKQRYGVRNTNWYLHMKRQMGETDKKLEKLSQQEAIRIQNIRDRKVDIDNVISDYFKSKTNEEMTDKMKVLKQNCKKQTNVKKTEKNNERKTEHKDEKKEFDLDEYITSLTAENPDFDKFFDSEKQKYSNLLTNTMENQETFKEVFKIQNDLQTKYEKVKEDSKKKLFDVESGLVSMKEELGKNCCQVI